MKLEGTASTETDDMKEILLGPQPMRTQESHPGKLPTSILNVVHDATTQALKVLGNVLVGDSSRNE